MATKSILLAVADPQALVEMTQALGAGWEPTSVASEADALQQLEARSFDALLVDFNFGTPDASDLLNGASEKRPETARFLMAYEADLALVAAKVSGSHQILPKPLEPASFKSRIEEGVTDSSSDQTTSSPATDPGAAPLVPAIYSEVLKALETPGVTNEQVGKLIALDSALTTELLRLTKSAYMGLPRDISEPTQAVESLGLDAVKALVTALRFLAEHSHLKPCYLSIDQIWQHSTNVAQIARDLVLFETEDRALASQALAAGLLHDLGKVVLVTNFADLYGRVYSLARKQPVPVWEIEKEMFGATHGEVGACLVGMWNMPGPIVEATAMHHEPPLGEGEQLTPLAAVHIANVLEHQLRPSDECRVAPIINTAFLNELGLLQRLPIWRATFANRGPGAQPADDSLALTEVEESAIKLLDSTGVSRSGNHLKASTAATRTATSGQLEQDQSLPASPVRQRRWVYGAVTAGIVFLLALYLRLQPDANESADVYARMPVTHRARAAVQASPSPERVPAAAPDATDAPESAVNTSASSVPKQTASQPQPETTPATVSHERPANVSTPSLPPQESAAPEFRLNGIIYTVARPSAIVNGKTVFVGEQINGATVISISQTAVSLQIDGHRRTYDLR
jgi:HD-like signal output (HDOD) protein